MEAAQPTPGDSNTFKVLVAVDVQNCFLFANKNDEKADYLNLVGELPVLDNKGKQVIENGTKVTKPDPNPSIEVTKEIAAIISEYKPNACVFSRDLHPINHISFAGDEGRAPIKGTTWHPHCRFQGLQCESRLANATQNGGVPGEDLSTPAAPKPPKKLNQVSIKRDKDEKTAVADANKVATTFNQLKSKIVKNEKDMTEYTQKSSTDATNPDATKSDYIHKLFNTEDQLTGEDIVINGNELSYLFYDTDIAEPIAALNIGNKLGLYKFGMEDSKYEPLYPKKINPRSTNANPKLTDIGSAIPYVHEGIKYISLTKGERCNQESYSAFNYHIEYTMETEKGEKGRKVVHSPVDIASVNSTGLWEWILANRGNAENIEICVCGLVGNVCVMYTVIQGMAMWELVYKPTQPENITVNFVYSTMGTRFTTAMPPNEIKPDLSDADSFINWITKQETDKTDEPNRISYYGGNLLDENVNQTMLNTKFEVNTNLVGEANRQTYDIHTNSWLFNTTKQTRPSTPPNNNPSLTIDPSIPTNNDASPNIGAPTSKKEPPISVYDVKGVREHIDRMKKGKDTRKQGGRRSTRKTNKYCKKCKGCCKRNHTRKRGNHRKTRR
jgi:nicotinamidase-related amidase